MKALNLLSQRSKITTSYEHINVKQLRVLSNNLKRGNPD
jgi:hypothetical protein